MSNKLYLLKEKTRESAGTEMGHQACKASSLAWGRWRVAAVSCEHQLLPAAEDGAELVGPAPEPGVVAQLQ